MLKEHNAVDDKGRTTIVPHPYLIVPREDEP